MPTIVLIGITPVKLNCSEYELSFCREWSFMSKKLIGYLQCTQEYDVPNIPVEAYGVYGTPSYMIPAVVRQQIEQAE